MSRPVALALRAAGIGDLLTAVPALGALGAALPEHRVLVAAPAWLSELVHLVPGVDGLVPVDGLAPPQTGRVALAVNLHGSGPESHEALVAVKPAELWAYRCAPVWPEGPVWDDGDHERDRWCRLLEWHGVPADPEVMALRAPRVVPARVGAVIVHLGGKDPRRRLGMAAAATVAARLQDLGHDVLLTGDSGDRARATRVAEAAGLPAQALLAGSVSLGELAALVANAELVVSGDTGAAHLASAYATPSVVVFGPEPVERWGPPVRPYHRVLRAPAADVSRVPGERILEASLDVLSVSPARALLAGPGRSAERAS